MGCLNKRRFANPIKPKNRTSFDKYMIQAGCGCCAGCNKTKSNDWLVRAYFEYMSKPTTCFFVSLDFDEEHVPKYNGQKCFDSELMHDFFEALRQVLPPFRYLYSSHLGEAMQGPHYHVMFYFDRYAVSWSDFFAKINKFWKYGQHEDVSELRSVRDNALAGIQYCTKYTTRDRKALSYFKRQNFPKRYRPQTHASVGFGAQCMDPSEFLSDNLRKAGVIFDERPTITRKFILNNSLVYLDIKNDGVLVPFSIPRYYELKLMYNYKWNSEEKKQEVIKNDYGVELQKIRHNANYIHLFGEFKNSRNLKIHEDHYVSMIVQHVFPDSPYLGMEWKDVVHDVLDYDEEPFWDFCKVYSMLEFDMKDYGFMRFRPLKLTSIYESNRCNTFNSYYYHAANCGDSLEDFYDSSIDLYIYALSHYLIWKDVQNRRRSEFEDWKAAEQVKVKIKEKCKRKQSYYWHLRRHGFKFYNLNPSPYVSHYQIKED